jgi:hypothetical protein
MAQYLVRIEANSDWNDLHIASNAAWVRGDVRPISFTTVNVQRSWMLISAKDLRLSQIVRQSGSLRLEVQIETDDQTVQLETDKGSLGRIVVTSAADQQINAEHGGGHNRRNFTLVLDPAHPGANARGDRSLAEPRPFDALVAESEREANE